MLSIEKTTDGAMVHNDTSPTSIFEKLIQNAEHNYQKASKHRRYSEVILFIYSGPLAYNYIQQNMPTALPNLRTLQTRVNKDYSIIKDGEFRFNQLLHYLQKHSYPKIIAVGEDATRVISRIDYDSCTDQLVGFVLPVDGNGLPIQNSFTASSVDVIENHFLNGNVAKYAFTYMAQPLSRNASPFVLACFSSSNQFTAELVLQRWRHIQVECAKLGIHVISFSADGDSREMKSMRVSTKLQCNDDSCFSSSPSSFLPKLKISNDWMEWFAVNNPTEICYVQDTVHIAVKMKSRLLKPSVVLPLGSYTAGMHSLVAIKTAFCKAEHGLREKDLDQKDKQNYESVMRITNSSSLELLKKIPDAVGTYYYLDVLRCVVDSYLDKQLSPMQRIEKIWYAVFFLRFWRDYITANKKYTLENNFVSQNAYMCVELNAHALILLLIVLRDKYEVTEFMPWLLGSQTCEKALELFEACLQLFQLSLILVCLAYYDDFID